MIQRPTARDYFGISVFWLAISFFWGAMLFVVIQTKLHSLVEAENPAVARIANSAVTPNGQVTLPDRDRAKNQIEATVASRNGWLLGFGAFVATITQLVFGALSDNSRNRKGRRRPYVVVGTLLSSAAIALFPFVQSFAALLVIFLLIQFFINVATGPYQALLPDLIPLEFHGTASSWMGLFQLVGRTGGMVGGALLMQSSTGLTILAWIFLITLNVCMLLTVRMTREPTLDGEGRLGFRQSILRAFAIDLRGHSSFVWVLISRFVINTGIYTILPFLLFFLMNCFHLTKDEALQKQMFIGLIINVTGMIATFPAGVASDRFSKKAVVYVTCIASIAGGLGFAFSGSPAVALVAAGIFGAGYGAFQAVDWALVCNVLPPGEPAKYMGVWGIADCVPQIVAPFAGGAIATWTISAYNSSIGYRAVMVSALVWFLLGTVCIRWVKERRAGDDTNCAADPMGGLELEPRV